MTMVPARDPKICPVCGERREGGCHACPGPRVASPDAVFRAATRHAETVLLPGEEPYDTEAGLARLQAWMSEHVIRDGDDG